MYVRSKIPQCSTPALCRLVAALMFVLAITIAEFVDAQTCTERTFSVGTLDPRFGLSSTTLVQNLVAAAGIWETTAGRKLFSFAPTGGMITIDLLYDSRQESTLALRAREEKLSTIKTVFAAVQASYTRLVQETQSEVARNTERFAQHARELELFNADVARVNARGGATVAESADFAVRHDRLVRAFAEYKTTERTLNERISGLNSLAASLNTVVEVLNGFVKRHNEALANMGEFEEGYYKRVGATESIGIYSFADQAQLTRVLAHEMGHALGMQHIVDPEAIMYQVNKGVSLLPTVSDRAELARVCRI